MILIILLLVIIAIRLFIFLKDKVIISYGCVNFITGSVKSGKTLFCVSKAIRETNRRRFRIFIQNLFTKYKQSLPLLYSNIPLKYKWYTPLTLSIIRREENVIKKSVVLIDECSLLADSMTFNDSLLNERLGLFIKLFGHSSHGGIMFINSQDLKDVHYEIKRSVSDIYYIDRKIKLPFITIQVFKRFNSVVDDTITTNEQEYISIVNNKTYQVYDCYCYSVLTDDNKIIGKGLKIKYLKQPDVLTFRKFKTLKKDK